jgi:DNA-binding FadR family transcriptional regulator
VELYEMREAIEPYAAAKASQRASESQIAAIGRTVRRMRTLADNVGRTKNRIAGKRDTSEFEKADLAFHMLIIDATGNQTMVRVSESSNALVRVFATQRHAYDAQIMKSTCEDHVAVLDGIRAGKPNVASDAMQQHLAAGLELTLHAIESRKTNRWEMP